MRKLLAESTGWTIFDVLKYFLGCNSYTPVRCLSYLTSLSQLTSTVNTSLPPPLYTLANTMANSMANTMANTTTPLCDQGLEVPPVAPRRSRSRSKSKGRFPKYYYPFKVFLDTKIVKLRKRRFSIHDQIQKGDLEMNENTHWIFLLLWKLSLRVLRAPGTLAF